MRKLMQAFNWELVMMGFYILTAALGLGLLMFDKYLLEVCK